MPDRKVASLNDLEALLGGAGLLGIELDTRYRVLGATVEPRAEETPGVDRRLQLVASPVSTVLASLRRTVATAQGERVEVYTFTDEQLLDVVSAVEGASLDGPVFGRPEPRPGTYAPQWSLEGRSPAPDGTSRTLTLSVRHDDGAGTLHLDLFARFDELRVRDAHGTEVLVVPAPGVLDLGL